MLLLAGCGTSPLGLEPSCARYVSVAGTPRVTAEIWPSGVVNLCYRVQYTSQSRLGIPACATDQLVTWRGQKTGDLITGSTCTTGNPDYAIDPGSMVLLVEGDILQGQIQTQLASPCGPIHVDVPVTLVPRWRMP